MRSIVFDSDPRRPWLGARSVRSLQHAGLSHVETLAPGEKTELGSKPILLLRAGSWLRDRRPFKPPPPSATGRSLVAVGQPHGGESAQRWLADHGHHGGDFGKSEAAPPLVCAWVEAGLFSHPALAGHSHTMEELWNVLFPSGEAPKEKATASHRTVRWHLLDVEFDEGFRVIQVVTSLQHGGAERVAWDLHQVLPKLGIASCIVTLGHPLRSQLPEPPDWVDLAGMDSEERGHAMNEVTGRYGADLIHAHLIDRADAQRFSKAGVPLVMTIHNMRPGWPEGLDSLRSREAALLVACAQAVEGELVSAVGTVPVRTVWNGVDVKAFAAARPPLGNGHAQTPHPRALTVACIANPRYQKRLHLLPAILAALRARWGGRPDDVKLIIAGEASQRSAEAMDCLAQTQAEAQKYGVSSGIEWTQGETSVASVLGTSDVVVSPSLYEGLSLGQVEALASGLPLVATDVGGNAELAWNQPGVKLLPQDATPEQFADAILLMTSGLKRPDATLLKHFTREAMASRYRWLYNSVWMPRSGPVLWFVTNNLSTGGAQSSLRRLVKALADDRVPVRVGLLQEYLEHPTTGRSDLEDADIPITVLPPAGALDAAEAVAQLLDEMRLYPPKAVVFWNVIPVYKMLLADALFRVPIYDVSPGEMYFASLDRYFANPRTALPYRCGLDYGERLAGVIVKYRAEADLASKYLGAPVHVIPNGVPLPPRSTGKEPGDQLVLGTAARIHPQKRLEDLLEAFRLALPKLPPCVLKIAGGVEAGCDEYAASLHDRAAGLPVEWLGDRADIGAWHAEIDLFLMISEPAGCPNASLEAMAAGLPVVATDVGGASEQVREGETGRLVAARDPQAFADAIVELANGPETRHFGEAGRRRIVERFRLEKMVAEYRAVLEQ